MTAYNVFWAFLARILHACLYLKSFQYMAYCTNLLNYRLQVKEFLQEKHGDKYFVFNVSEKKYEKSRFDGRVSDYNWQDHHAPPFHLLFNLVEEMKNWLQGKFNNHLYRLIMLLFQQLIPKTSLLSIAILERVEQELPHVVCSYILDFMILCTRLPSFSAPADSRMERVLANLVK